MMISVNMVVVKQVDNKNLNRLLLLSKLNRNTQIQKKYCIDTLSLCIKKVTQNFPLTFVDINKIDYCLKDVKVENSAIKH